MPIPTPTPMTEADIDAAAARDPDARPFTPEELAQAKRIPRARTLRRALGLTQEEFAARYRIPLGTLRDWEQGRSEPDPSKIASGKPGAVHGGRNGGRNAPADFRGQRR